MRFYCLDPHLLSSHTLSAYALLDFQVCTYGFVGSKKLPSFENITFAFLPEDYFLQKLHTATVHPFFPYFRPIFILFSLSLSFSFTISLRFVSFLSRQPYSTNSSNTLWRTTRVRSLVRPPAHRHFTLNFFIKKWFLTQTHKRPLDAHEICFN